MRLLALVYFSVQSFHWAQVPEVCLQLLQPWPMGPGASRPTPEDLALVLAWLTITQQFCMLQKDVFCLQPPRATCSHTCPVISEQSVISKLLRPLPGPCHPQLPQIPSQWWLRCISFFLQDRFLIGVCCSFMVLISCASAQKCRFFASAVFQ